MYTFKINYRQLSDRLDPKYYNPKSQSIIDIISKEYDNVSLNELAQTIKKGIFEIPASVYLDEGEIPFIRVSNVKHLTIDKYDLVYIPEEWDIKNIKTRLEPGDLVITKGGTIGNVAIIPPWIKRCNISQDIIGIKLNKEADPYYIALFLDSKVGKIQMYRVKTEQLQPHLNLDVVRNTRIIFFDNYRKLSESIKKAINMRFQALNKLKKAIKTIHEIIDINMEDPPSTNFWFIRSQQISNEFFTPAYYYPLYVHLQKKLEKKFSMIELGECCDIIKGIEVGSKNYKKYINSKMDDVPFIRTSDFVNWEINNYPDFFIDRKLFNKIKLDLKPGDILFTNDGKIGLSAILMENDECVIQSHIRRIRLKNKYATKIDPFYIFAFLNTPYGLFQVYRYIVIQSTISTISDNLNKIKIPLIPIEEQKRVGKIIKDAMYLKNQAKSLLINARRRLDSIIGGYI